MRKILIAFLLVLSLGSKSWGDMCGFCSDPDPNPVMGGCVWVSSRGCDSNGVEVLSCDECQDGFTQQSHTSVDCGSYNTCVANCDSCVGVSCPNIGWDPYGAGYERYIYRGCNCGACVNTDVDYRCAAGYYGTTSNGTTGCNSCITATGNSSSTSSAGSTTITSCYLPTNYSAGDSTGTWKYTQNCNYSL